MKDSQQVATGAAKRRAPIFEHGKMKPKRFTVVVGTGCAGAAQ